MIKLSIIVPVYNVEKYLKRCMESALHQEMPASDYEIILINDGSTDQSETVALHFKDNNPNITYSKQVNQGVSVARNKGIDIARGEYIIFLDSDDALYPNILEKVYNKAKENDLDLLYFKIDYFNENDVKTGEFKMESEAFKIADGYTHQRRGYIFGLYKKETIQNLRFVKGIPVGEDALFNILVHTHAKRIAYLHEPTYKHYLREGSVIQSEVRGTDKAFKGYLKTLEEILKIKEKYQKTLTPEQLSYYDRPLFVTLDNIFKDSILPKLNKERYHQAISFMKEKAMEYLFPKLRQRNKFAGYNWHIFSLYHKLKKLKSGLKNK